jgi:hypothetical protein
VYVEAMDGIILQVEGVLKDVLAVEEIRYPGNQVTMKTREICLLHQDDF